MKYNIHTLTLQEHFDFLNQERKDPITGDLIKENDKVVFCASCKSAFLKESWEYIGNRHCEQNQTLTVIPKNKTLVLNYDAPNYFKIKEKEPKSSIIIAIILAILSVYTLDFLFSGYFKYICIVFAILITLIYLSSSFFSLNEIIIGYSELRLVKGWDLKDDIPYKNITQIIFLVKKISENNDNLHSNFHIIGDDLPETVLEPIFISINYIDFNEQQGFIKLISELSKKTKVVFKIDSSLQNYIAYKNIAAPIEWI
ncbi:hypothetical protein [Bernardetia sp. MNP-M8]|uniref:hypothetical protein n=1 Tax=Bernardetia sp. MNP-M8 TaxID=3127470 RepID=UPI0030CF1731